uniref:Uncharacterized protein n=1 Tax=Anguilla anguilla TaxID=7936 RepID=A0A0E9RKS1_ANGAN
MAWTRRKGHSSPSCLRMPVISQIFFVI